MLPPPRAKLGFSLVELSIVLVILGLLVGGVLSGQSLIRASELRSVSSDMARHMTAVQTFRDKYFALPGDMSNAQQFWGSDTVSSCGASPVAGDRVAKTATCNGNGDGQIAANTTETFRVWQHLANAGLIEGSYTGVTGAGGNGDHDPGINSPRLRVSNTGASLFWHGTVAAGHLYLFEGNYGNAFTYGICTIFECIEEGFKPEEAWNIDTKMDDGKPGLGKIAVRAITAPMCTNAVSTAAGQAASASYLLTNTVQSCGIYLRDTF